MDKGKTSAGSKNKTQDGEVILKRILKEKGFSFKEPQLTIAVDAFKEMSRMAFDCEEDQLLFETGCYDFDGKEMFCLSLVRQFTVVEDEGEFDYIEQLNLDFLYEVSEQVKGLAETVWSYEFEDDFERFFEAVEGKAGYQMALGKLRPVAVELYMDEV